jgi:hypothetical protein
MICAFVLFRRRANLSMRLDHSSHDMDLITSGGGFCFTVGFLSAFSSGGAALATFSFGASVTDAWDALRNKHFNRATIFFVFTLIPLHLL